MKKYLWFLPIFLLACKKNPGTALIATRQQPSRIDLLSVDTNTGAETPLFSFVYGYNETANRFDSITTISGANKTNYIFDYSKLDTEHKVLLNFIDSTSYGEFIFDTNNYTLSAYHDQSPVQGFTGTGFQYDSYARITRYDENTFPSSENYFRTYSYRGDTTIVHSKRSSDNCISDDTLFPTLYDMNYRLPYLFFTNIFSIYSCGTPALTLASALPFSNFVNKLPAHITSGDINISYEYLGDAKGRLAEATITRTRISTAQIINKVKIRMTY